MATADAIQLNDMRALCEEDENNLAGFERRLDYVRDRTSAIAKRHHTGGLIYGRAGTGKTYTVEETLTSLDVPWQLWNSRVSPMGLWSVMQDNPEAVIVVDDVATLFTGTNKAALQVLLAALGGRAGEPRSVKYATKDDRISFDFLGGIIAICNDLPKRNPLADAFVSRVQLLEHNPTDAMLAAFMRSMALKGYKGLPAEVCTEVVEFVLGEAQDSDYRLDLRHMQSAWEDYRFWALGESHHHWQALVRSNMRRRQEDSDPSPISKQEEIQLQRLRVKDALEKFDDSKMQREYAGLSKSTFYNRKKEVMAGL